jgi:hypothetical protein
MVSIKRDISEIEDHDLHWMLADAIALIQMERNYSAILILLCAVDGLAKRAYPKTKEVRKRVEAFLESAMRRPGRPQVWNIYVPPRNELLSFEYIIYKYLRNPIVHEGACLELDHPNKYTVRIDWKNLRRGIKVDSDNNQVILGGELILDILVDAVIEGMRNA